MVSATKSAQAPEVVADHADRGGGEERARRHAERLCGAQNRERHDPKEGQRDGRAEAHHGQRIEAFGGKEVWR